MLVSEVLFAEVVELVDTLSWGGSGATRAGSSPAFGTNPLGVTRFFVIVNECETKQVGSWDNYLDKWLSAEDVNSVTDYFTVTKSEEVEFKDSKRIYSKMDYIKYLLNDINI